MSSRIGGISTVIAGAAIALVLSACGSSTTGSSTTTTVPGAVSSSSTASASASASGDYAPVSCSAIQSAAPGASSWQLDSSTDSTQGQLLNDMTPIGAPASEHLVGLRICGWSTPTWGPLAVYFCHWASPLTKAAWLTSSKAQIANTTPDDVPGLGSWAVGEDQSLTKQDYVLLVTEGDGSWGYEVNVGDTQTLAQVLPIAQAVQGLIK